MYWKNHSFNILGKHNENKMSVLNKEGPFIVFSLIYNDQFKISQFESLLFSIYFNDLKTEESNCT